MSESATHICGECGALWRCVPDDGRGAAWSLKSPKAGPCCDNVEMGLQIIPLADADALAAELEMTREDAAALEYADRRAKAEAAVRGSCGTCRHFKPDPNAGIPYHGEPHPDAGYCQLHGSDGNGPCIMLSGDWCEQFEARQ